MPYSLFCAGNNGFHYSQARIYTVGDLYDIRDSMARLTTGATEGAAAVAQGMVADEVMPDTDYTRQAMEAQVGLLDQRSLDIQLTAALTRMYSLRVTVAAHNSGWIWSDSGFASVMLYGGESGQMLVLAHAIHPALAAAGLNGVGVLGHIGNAISAFAGSDPVAFPGGPDEAHFMLNFSLAQV